MIRKSGNRFSLATNAERVCAEIMLKQIDEIMNPESEARIPVIIMFGAS
jgi:hypothetical protein